MLAPSSLIRVWGPPSAVVDEVTGDVQVNIGGVVIETVSRAYDARQKLADEAVELAPTPQPAVVAITAGTPDPNPRQLEVVPPVEPLGPGANMSSDQPPEQLPPMPSETTYGGKADDDALGQKKTIIGKLLGDRKSDTPPKRDSKAPSK